MASKGGRVAAGALGGFASGGPIGALIGGIGGLFSKDREVFRPKGRAELEGLFPESFAGFNKLGGQAAQFAAGQNIVDPRFFQSLETHGSEALTETLAGSRAATNISAARRGIEGSGIQSALEQEQFGTFAGGIGKLLGGLQQQKFAEMQRGKEFGLNLGLKVEQSIASREQQLNQLLAQGTTSANLDITESNKNLSIITEGLTSKVNDYFNKRKTRQGNSRSKSGSSEPISKRNDRFSIPTI